MNTLALKYWFTYSLSFQYFSIKKYSTLSIARETWFVKKSPKQQAHDREIDEYFF